jgi:hypothetical protein
MLSNLADTMWYNLKITNDETGLLNSFLVLRIYSLHLYTKYREFTLSGCLSGKELLVTEENEPLKGVFPTHIWFGF